MNVSEISVARRVGDRFSTFTYGCNAGIISTTEMPKHPVYSIVTNVNGRTFWLLHKASNLGKVCFSKSQK